MAWPFHSAIKGLKDKSAKAAKKQVVAAMEAGIEDAVERIEQGRLTLELAKEGHARAVADAQRRTRERRERRAWQDAPAPSAGAAPPPCPTC
eukprot:COSAG01_NODE_12426_length_1741_cov_4.522533_1_plen_91_part_10